MFSVPAIFEDMLLFNSSKSASAKAEQACLLLKRPPTVLAACAILLAAILLLGQAKAVAPTLWTPSVSLLLSLENHQWVLALVMGNTLKGVWT